MDISLIQITAFLALVPPSLTYFRKESKKDTVFWSSIIVALSGTLLIVFVRQSSGWQTGFSTSLWLTILSCTIIYAITSFISSDAWRLSFLLYPYLLVLGIFAIIWSQVPERPFTGNAHIAWLGTHIVVTIATYGMITLAALAALAAVLQERCVKLKKRSKLARSLPSIAASEKLLVNLLVVSEIILFIGLCSGVASLYLSKGYFFVLDHKTIFALIVFGIIGLMLFLHYKVGLRGRLAMRYVLLAYLLLTLGYPGVKFVTDVIISS